MICFVKDSSKRSGFLDVVTMDDAMQKVISSEVICKADFFKEIISKVARGKFVREFVFVGENRLHFEWAKSTVYSFEESSDDYVFALDQNDLYMKKLRNLECGFQRVREDFRKQYDESATKAKSLLAFRTVCYQVMEDYHNKEVFDTKGYDLKDIVRYIEQYKRPYWPKFDIKKGSSKYAAISFLASASCILSFFTVMVCGFYGNQTSFLLSLGTLCISGGLAAFYKSFYSSEIYNRIASSLEYISEHQDEYEASILEKELAEKIESDKFYEWMMRDIAYIKTHPNFDFNKELSALKALNIEFGESSESELAGNCLANRERAMKALLVIEKNIFSKLDDSSIIASRKTMFSFADLCERLCSLGEGTEEFVKEPFIQSLSKCMSLLMTNSLVDVNERMLSFYNVALDYVVERSQYVSLQDFEQSDSYSLFSNRKYEIEYETLNTIRAIYGCSLPDNVSVCEEQPETVALEEQSDGQVEPNGSCKRLAFVSSKDKNMEL